MQPTDCRLPLPTPKLLPWMNMKPLPPFGDSSAANISHLLVTPPSHPHGTQHTSLRLSQPCLLPQQHPHACHCHPQMHSFQLLTAHPSLANLDTCYTITPCTSSTVSYRKSKCLRVAWSTASGNTHGVRPWLQTCSNLWSRHTQRSKHSLEPLSMNLQRHLEHQLFQRAWPSSPRR